MYLLTPWEPIAELRIRGTHFVNRCLRPLSNDWNIAVIFTAFIQTTISLKC